MEGIGQVRRWSMIPAWRNTDSLVWLAAAFCVIAALPSARPDASPLYFLLSVGVVVGAMLGVRLAPGRLATSLVILPATVAGMRIGDAGAPAVLYATLLAALVRGGALAEAARR